jgi:hypothetical protein
MLNREEQYIYLNKNMASNNNISPIEILKNIQTSLGGIKNVELITPERMRFDYLEKNGEIKKERRGGYRANGGRKTSLKTIKERGIKEIIDAHANEKVKIKVTDPKTGITKEVLKPRSLILLEDLFIIGHNEKDTVAIDKWFDRAIGKPVTKIGNENDEPFRIDIRIGPMIHKIYGDEH